MTDSPTAQPHSTAKPVRETQSRRTALMIAEAPAAQAQALAARGAARVAQAQALAARGAAIAADPHAALTRVGRELPSICHSK